MNGIERGFDEFWAALRRRSAGETARPAFLGITGAVHAGKTTAARALISALRARGVTCCGVLSRARIVGGRYIGYDIEDISTSETRALARTAEENSCFEGGFDVFGGDALRVGRYAFDADAFALGERCIGAAPPQSVAFVDEMGRLERRGLGLARAAQAAAERCDLAGLVWVLRQDSAAHWQSMYRELRIAAVAPRG